MKRKRTNSDLLLHGLIFSLHLKLFRFMHLKKQCLLTINFLHGYNYLFRKNDWWEAHWFRFAVTVLYSARHIKLWPLGCGTAKRKEFRSHSLLQLKRVSRLLLSSLLSIFVQKTKGSIRAVSAMYHYIFESSGHLK